MSRKIYINGKIFDEENATINVADIGFQRGYGVFDYVRIVNGKLFHFDEHLFRLRRSAANLKLTIALENNEIHSIAEKLIAESQLNNPALRIIVSGGTSEFGLIIAAEELHQWPSTIYKDGVKVITVEYQREFPETKHLNYIFDIWHSHERQQQGAFDSLYFSQNYVTELPRANFFLFNGDNLVTPKSHVLQGITRRIILELAAPHYHIEERSIAVDELRECSEAFCSSTSKDIVPIIQIDENLIGDGYPGKRNRKIMQLFAAYCQAY